jgi:hypothetical protein
VLPISQHTIDFLKEALRIIPITEFPFHASETLEKRLHHGFTDIGEFFPSWREFLDRSLGKIPGYENYMAYLLTRHEDDEIIGVLAVQLATYDILKTKVFSLTPDIDQYLYLSWIALDTKFQKVNYFAFMFEFYHALVRRFQVEIGTRIGGAAIAIRRMRPYIWSLLNVNQMCPGDTDRSVYKETTRITLYIRPSETISPDIKPTQDHVLFLFGSSRGMTK